MLTGGVALVLDACVTLGLTVELGFLALELIKLRSASCLCIYQNILIHLLLLIILAANCQ